VTPYVVSNEGRCSLPKLTKKEALERELDGFRRRKKNRTLEEVATLLRNWGFVERPGTKERGGVWTRAGRRVVLPKPHGGDKVLAPRYVSIVVEEIEQAELIEPLEIN
jgi:hypothetical protein